MHSSKHTPLPDARFAHERLDVYSCALELVVLASELAKRLPRTKGQLGDQLLRASESIPLRISEGVGAEPQSADQKRYFRAARGSAMECAAIMDVCRLRGVGNAKDIHQARQLLLRIVQMLSRLSKRS